MECPFCVGADNMSTRNCANNCNVTLGHNMFFNTAHYLHESGTAARRIRTADNLKILVIRCVFYSI